jgi:hypothetical protein
VTDSPHVEDDQLPHAHNPVERLPWLNQLVEIQSFQHRAGLTVRLAEWCGGEIGFNEGSQTVRVPTADGEAEARLGDWVLSDGTQFWVLGPADFAVSYWPVGRDPGWEWRCYRTWEEQP